MNPAPTPSNQPGRRWPDIAAGAVVVGACGVCCAGPLLALLGGIGVASLAVAVLVPAPAVLAVVAGGSAFWLWRRRRRARGDRAAVSGAVVPGVRP